MENEAKFGDLNNTPKRKYVEEQLSQDVRNLEVGESVSGIYVGKGTLTTPKGKTLETLELEDMETKELIEIFAGVGIDMELTKCKVEVGQAIRIKFMGQKETGNSSKRVNTYKIWSLKLEGEN